MKWLIACTALLCMALLLATMIVFTSNGAREEAVLLASKATQGTSKLLTEQARRMLEPAEATVRQLAFDPLVTATTLDERVQRLHPLATELRTNPLLAAIYVGYDNGDFMLLRLLDSDEVRKRYEAPAQAEFVVQSIQTSADGNREGSYLFYSINHELLLQRPQADYRFEPRARAWYQLAVKQLAVVVSEPYVFLSTQKVGITVSQKSRLGAAVVGADVVIDELAQSLSALRTTPGTQIALVDADNKVLVHPNMPTTLRPQGGNMVFSSLQELKQPALTALASKKPNTGPAHLYELRGQEWLGVSMPFKGWRIDGVRLLIAMPSNEVIGQMQRRNTQLVALIAGLGVLLVALGWWAGTFIGRRLGILSGRAAHIGQIELAQPKRRNSLMREVNALSDTLDSTGEILQSFLDIDQILLTEPNLQRMLSVVLERAVNTTQSDGGIVFLWNETTQTMGDPTSFGNLPEGSTQAFEYPDDRPIRAQARSLSSGQQQAEWVLRSTNGNLKGMLLLLRTANPAQDSKSFEAFANRLASVLAAAIEMRQLLKDQKPVL